MKNNSPLEWISEFSQLLSDKALSLTGKNLTKEDIESMKYMWFNIYKKIEELEKKVTS